MVNETYPLPLSGLRYFLWAAKKESFKGAAESLNVSEAAVSQQIRNLESLLDCKLFDRLHQKVVLTAKGHQLLPFVDSGFKSLQQGIQILRNDQFPNRLNLSTMPSFASPWLINKLVNLKQKHPELSISIDTSIERHSFDTGEIDLAIRYGLGNYPGLKSEFLMADPTVLVCSPKLLKLKTITRQSIIDYPMIVSRTDGVKFAMEKIKQDYQIDEIELSESLELRDGSLGADAARSGQGISLQRLSFVADMIEREELIFAKDFAFHEFNFFAVAPSENFNKPKVKKFLAWLKAEMALTAQSNEPLVAQLKA